MSKQLNLMLAFNVLWGMLFILSSYAIWETLNNFVAMGYGETTWSPFIITVDTGMLVYDHLINTPFVLFLMMFALNLVFFIIKLGRSKEAKQIT